MYKKIKPAKTSITVNQSELGESIELKMQRILNNQERVTDASELIYTERKDGVQAEYNIKTDKWEVAADAQDKAAKEWAKSREQRMGEKAYEGMTIEAQQEFNTKFPKNKWAKAKITPETGNNTQDSKSDT